MKTVFHMTYKDVDVDLDIQDLDTPEQIAGAIDLFLNQGFKPRPKFVKNGENGTNHEGKYGVIVDIEAAKTKGDKDTFICYVKTDDMAADTVKSGMVKIFSMPISRGKKNVCMWNVGTRVKLFKNDRGYLDMDDATGTDENMTDEEKKS